MRFPPSLPPSSLLHLHPPLLLLLKAEVQEERSISQTSEVTVTKAAVAQSARLGVGRGGEERGCIDLPPYSEHALFISES